MPMRLVCPNCGAKYDVAADAVPPQGRDVQCSSCDHVWFEIPGQSDDSLTNVAPATPQAEAAAVEPVPSSPAPAPVKASPPKTDSAVEPAPEFNAVAAEPEPEPESREPTPAELAAEVRRARDIASDTEQKASEQISIKEKAATNSPEPIDPADELSSPRLTPEIKDILREEAQLERSVRRAASDERDAEKASRRKPLDGMSTEDYFPDIDDLSSGMRADDMAVAAAAVGGTAVAAGRSGFWRAFALICLAALVAALIYIFADEIVTLIPATKGILSGYINVIDSLRASIATAIGGAA